MKKRLNARVDSSRKIIDTTCKSLKSGYALIMEESLNASRETQVSGPTQSKGEERLNTVGMHRRGRFE